MNLAEFPIQAVRAAPPNQTWVNTFSQRRYSSDMVALPIVGLAGIDSAGELAVAQALASFKACASPADYAVAESAVQPMLLQARSAPGNSVGLYQQAADYLATQTSYVCGNRTERTMLYVGIGVGALVLAGGAWWLLKRRH